MGSVVGYGDLEDGGLWICVSASASASVIRA